MNKYSKLSKEQMLEVCKLINPDGNWKFHEILDEGFDETFEFLSDDESCIQFNINRTEEDEIRCYLKGDWENDEIPSDKIELINDFLYDIELFNNFSNDD